MRPLGKTKIYQLRVIAPEGRFAVLVAKGRGDIIAKIDLFREL